MINPLLHRKIKLSAVGKPVTKRLLRGGNPFDEYPPYLEYLFGNTGEFIDMRDEIFSLRLFWTAK